MPTWVARRCQKCIHKATRPSPNCPSHNIQLCCALLVGGIPTITYPSEKYYSVGTVGMIIPIWKKCSKPPTSLGSVPLWQLSDSWRSTDATLQATPRSCSAPCCWAENDQMHCRCVANGSNPARSLCFMSQMPMIAEQFLSDVAWVKCYWQAGSSGSSRSKPHAWQ